MRNLKKILSISLSICLALSMAVISANALTVQEERGSIEAVYQIDEAPVKNTSISVHRVASVDNDLEYSWLEAFAKYSLTVDFHDSDKLAEVAQTLSSYISRDNVAATASAKTTDEGVATFANLEPGMYLLTGDTYRVGQYSYHAAPALISVPYTEKDGTLSFQTRVEIKHESQYHPSSPSTTACKVLKVWKTEDDTEIPTSVKVDLLRDGKLYKTQELNRKNNWTYTWRGLNKNHIWTVVEQSVPDGYTTASSKTGATFVITNTEKPAITPPDDKPVVDPPEPPVEPPEPPVEPPVDPPEPPVEPPVEPPAEPPVEPPSDPPVEPPVEPPIEPPDDKPPVNPPDKLPQTGLPWWEVFVMAGAGCGFIIIAIILDWNKKKIKYIPFIIGVLCISGAMFLTGKNLGEDRTAEQASMLAAEELSEYILDAQADTEQGGFVPNYVLDPDMDMPELELDNGQYVGILEIPALDLKLPIQNEWSAKNAKISPCRYTGSIYDNDCIIAGHNFKAHFAKLSALKAGDDIRFTDMEGNEFFYKVASIEVLDGTDIEGMETGSWDLTLFTCTVGGKQRVTVRCNGSEQAVSGI